MTEIRSIVNKYRKNEWLFGQFIPTDERRKHKIMFIGEKPSDYFSKHPEKRYLGNYNATKIDEKFQKYIKKHKLGRVYITDMVKTEGLAGAKFEDEWCKDKNFKNCLIDEINFIKPKLVICISKKVENLFNTLNLGFCEKKIYHPSYVFRYNKFRAWDKQFKQIYKFFNN
ncbi:MAG: uracil-DNA glycosylase family protein [Patescibacteria group bacterium]|nr:uracil-DNA glycosylase family protein [Patescibacteria group bacterium]